MTRSTDEANREISRVRKMPYGIARTQAAEQQVRLVEAEGPDEVRAYALNVLVESFVWGGEVERAYLPFTKAVRWYDEHPEHFDAEDTHGLFWSFKWMVGHLSDFPDIPAEQIEATLADMERRYALAGLGRDAVAFEAFGWARLRGSDDVDALYEEWVRTPRDDYSQCRACDPGDRASYLVARGDHDEAVRLIQQTLDSGVTCATEPADMLSTLALVHLDAGRADAAVAAHRRAVAALAGSPSDMTGARGARFVLLARGGQTRRALRALTEDAHLLLAADTPNARFDFLTDVVAGTAALLPGAGAEPVAFEGVAASDVAGLHAWCVTEAAALAAAFDARNGTDRFARRLAEARETRPADVTLDLAVIPTGAAARPVRPAPEVVLTDAGAGPLGADPTSLPGGLHDGSGLVTAVESGPDRAERLVREGDLVAAAAVWLEESASAEAAGRLADSGLALAEAARCAQEAGDDEGAAATYPAAVARMRAGGVGVEVVTTVVVAWAPVAAATGDAQAVLAAVDALLAELDASDVASADTGAPADTGAEVAGAGLAERREAVRRRARADLDDTAARVLASTGPERAAEAAARATRAAEAYAGAGHVADAAHAFWLAGRLHDGLGQVDDAVWNLESAVEGFSIAHQAAPRGEAASALVSVLRAAGRDDRAEEVLRTLTR